MPKKKVRIYVYVCLGDSPEKYSISHITRGNGTYTSRWGHLIDIKNVYLLIPSCHQCRSENFLNCKDALCNLSYSCKTCMNWEFYGDNENLLLFGPPNKYPMDCDKLHNNKLRPQMVTSELLLKVCKTTHEKVSKGYWSSSEGDAYLKVHGLNDDLRQNIIECAENMFLMSNLEGMESKYRTYILSDQKKIQKNINVILFPRFGHHQWVLSCLWMHLCIYFFLE